MLFRRECQVRECQVKAVAALKLWEIVKEEFLEREMH